VHFRDAFSGGRDTSASCPNLNPCASSRQLSPPLSVPSQIELPPTQHKTRHPFNMDDDVHCSGSFSDDEMLDHLAQSQHDELPFSLHTVVAADGTSSKPDYDIPPVVHASWNSTAGRSPASSQDLEGDYETISSSRVYPPAGQQETALAASPEDVTPPTGSSVLARMESIFEAMADVLLNERGQLSVEIATRPRASRQHLDPVDSAPAQSNPVQRLCFPGKSEREAWRFGEHGPIVSACSSTDHKQPS
jgi:hypothetical protein